MTLRSDRTRAVGISLSFLLLGCDASPRLGAARQASCAGSSVSDVSVDPVLYHWEDPAHLLEAAEGFGPRNVSLNVSVSVQPSFSVTLTSMPGSSSSGAGGGDAGSQDVLQLLSETTLETSIGYSETEIFTVDASSSVFVGINEYATISAFTDYERSTWGVVGPGCQGTGVSYKPVGVYFKTCWALAGCPFLVGPISADPSDAGDGGDAGDAGDGGDGG